MTQQIPSKILARKAETMIRDSQWDAALDVLDQLQQRHGDNPWLSAKRGEVFRLTNRWEAAAAAFTQSLEQDPNYHWARAHRGTTLYQLRRYPKALEDFNQTIAALPDYLWAICYRPHVYIALKRYAEALTDVDRFLAVDTDLLPYWRGERGMILNYLGRYQETLALCDPAVAADENDYIARYTRAVAAHMINGSDKAGFQDTRACLQRVAQTGEPGLIAYRRGGLAALEGDIETALDFLAQAIDKHHEPIETARHDPAWFKHHHHPRYQELIAPAEHWNQNHD